jgi:hypothetical protein
VRALAALVLVGGLAAAEPEMTLAPRSLALGNRVDFVLGDGHHPFVDEDNRRALLALGLRATGHLAILGYAGATIERAVADTGEELQPTLPQDAGTTDDHVRHDDPSPTLFSIGLPSARAPYRGLKELRGAVEVVVSGTELKTWETPLSALKKDEDATIDGHEQLTIAPIDADGNQTAFRISPEARLAIIDLVFHDAAGKAIAIRPPRTDRREAKGKRRRQPVGGKEDVLLYPVALPKDATVAVRYYPVVERRHVAFALTDVAFGVAVPDLASARGAAQRGADDL